MTTGLWLSATTIASIRRETQSPPIDSILIGLEKTSYFIQTKGIDGTIFKDSNQMISWFFVILILLGNDRVSHHNWRKWDPPSLTLAGAFHCSFFNSLSQGPPRQSCEARFVAFRWILSNMFSQRRSLYSIRRHCHEKVLFVVTLKSLKRPANGIAVAHRTSDLHWYQVVAFWTCIVLCVHHSCLIRLRVPLIATKMECPFPNPCLLL